MNRIKELIKRETSKDYDNPLYKEETEDYIFTIIQEKSSCPILWAELFSKKSHKVTLEAEDIENTGQPYTTLKLSDGVKKITYSINGGVNSFSLRNKEVEIYQIYFEVEHNNVESYCVTLRKGKYNVYFDTIIGGYTYYIEYHGKVFSSTKKEEIINFLVDKENTSYSLLSDKEIDSKCLSIHGIEIHETFFSSTKREDIGVLGII